ncbi:MAG: DUF4826 family protein [Gammaproteobacteria bacterium]|nr:DUF4826 family protein [Gammaproteobacteria bacterium]
MTESTVQQDTSSTSNALSEEQIVAWSREAYQKASAHLADKGIITESVSMEQSRYLAPMLAVWKIKATDKNWYWVISGDLPTDVMTEEGADSARSAVKAFSYQWQMKAENIQLAGNADKTQQDFAQLLISRANGLYQLSERDELWLNA